MRIGLTFLLTFLGPGAFHLHAQEREFPLLAVALKLRPAAASEVSSAKREVIASDFMKGTEAKVLHAERVFNREWVYVHFINGPYKGKRGWLPFREKGAHIRLYAVEKHQSFQTLDITRARYVRTTEGVSGYLDFTYDLLADRSLIYDEKEYTLDFFERFPRTNFGLAEPVDARELKQACPARPVQRNGAPCLERPEKYKLPVHLKSAVRKAAREFNVHPAIVAAILQKESYFDPFSENGYEKNLCLRQGKDCPPYRWGQGLAQVGATNAREFEMEWQMELKRPAVCRKGHIFKQACFARLEKKCAAIKKRKGLWPTYCPSAGIRAVAKYVSSLINHEQWMRVDVKLPSGTWRERIVDVNAGIRRSLAEEFRYILGMYNRGKRPINSIEEHYRQFGRAPEWYDNAWLAARVEGETPSTQMGYMILHKEVINRCHVWQVAGLCGDSLQGTLAGAYLKDFPEWKPRPNGRRTIADETQLPAELLNDPDLNIDPSLFEGE